MLKSYEWVGRGGVSTLKDFRSRLGSQMDFPIFALAFRDLG